MGCVSSKLFRNDMKQKGNINNGGDGANHVVSLTSSTYGVLRLESEAVEKESVSESAEPEVINAWEMMEGLEEETKTLNRPGKSPNLKLFLRAIGDGNSRTPLKLLNQIASPRNGKRSGGKENRGSGIVRGLFRYSPRETPKSNKKTDDSCNNGLNSSFGKDKSRGSSFRRRSLTPLFDPELVEACERELSAEREQIQNPKSTSDSSSILNSFEQKCPPGGEWSVVIYTTTLRGIRKTFEDCNIVRTIIESHQIQTFERDVSMDSGFREQLRALSTTKEVKVPSVFVKGRLIGGANEVAKLEEAGKLGILFEGIAKVHGGCHGCGGVRFLLCKDCHGSCKVSGVGKKTKNKCGACNENGLIQCPICCTLKPNLPS